MVEEQTGNINLVHQSIVMVGVIEFEAKRFHSKIYKIAPYIPIAKARGITAFVDKVDGKRVIYKKE